MSLGVDYSFARPGGAAIKNAGFSFACRYLASVATKRITAAERDDLHAHGLDIVLVFEDYANQALNGYSQGVADAQEALNQAGAIGWPSNLPIYFAVDFDINDAQKPAAGEYFKGVASVIGLGRTGGYGGYYMVKYMFDHGLITYGWQTVAWSGGQIDSRVHIYQNGQSTLGGGADIDEAKQTNFGQWPAEGEDMGQIAELQAQVAGLQAELTGERAGYQAVLDQRNGLQAELDGERKGYAAIVAAVQAIDDSLGLSHAPDQTATQEARIAAIATLKNKPAGTPISDIKPKPLPNLNPLPIPVAPAQPKLSFWQRIWRALNG